MAYHSESAKVRDMPNVMKFVTGRIADVGCGGDKITPDAIGFDGRKIDGVDSIQHGLKHLWYIDSEGNKNHGVFETIFSSHFLEHVPDPYDYIMQWYEHIWPGGHLVLYLPQKDAYNSKENPEHLFNWSYEDFIFWFTRSFCGEGKDYRGEHLPRYFDLIESGLDIGPDRYSFYIVARKV